VSRLSVVLLVRNEEQNVRRALESVKWADEIVVVDDYSTDRTVDICREYTDRIFQRRLDDFDRQRNFGLAQATGEWILSLDADEEVTPELAAEIQAVIATNPPQDVFAIPFRDLIFGRWQQGGGWSRPNRRLYRRHCRWTESVHERVQAMPAEGQLQHCIRHYSHRSISGFLQKMDRYTTQEAQACYARGKRTSPLRLLLSPLRDFFIRYWRWGGYRDGMHGLVLAVLMAFYVFLVRAKVWELERQTTDH